MEYIQLSQLTTLPDRKNSLQLEVSGVEALPSTAVEEGKQWKLIWKINAPGKMKINLWRFVHDCLLPGIQLCRRNIPDSDVCIFCGKEEDVEHSFLLCPFAREVWRMVKAVHNIQLDRHDFLSPKLWLFKFLMRASNIEATVLAVGFWHLWDARKNGASPNPKKTSMRIISYTDMIMQHCSKTTSGTRCESTRPQRWTLFP
jgi:hypothetical protein